MYVYTYFVFFFFFQAEDGIRDYKVTGVQTCALPILPGLEQGRRVRRVSRPRVDLIGEHRRGQVRDGAGREDRDVARLQAESLDLLDRGDLGRAALRRDADGLALEVVRTGVARRSHEHPRRHGHEQCDRLDVAATHVSAHRLGPAELRDLDGAAEERRHRLAAAIDEREINVESVLKEDAF